MLQFGIAKELGKSLTEIRQLTMEEIGERNNYSRETARRYILKAIEKVKQCIPN